MTEANDEIQERVCRACDRAYRYPVLKSPATRFYCEACADLPPGVLAAFERLNKRVKTLAGKLEKLERAPAEGAKPRSPG